MPEQYSNAKEFESAIQTHLDPAAAHGAVTAALWAGISRAESAARAEPALPGNTALNVRLGGFVIRDADVPFLHALSAVSLAVAATFGTGGLTAPLAVAALTSLAELCWSVWRKGVKLDETQLLVLGVLRAQGPMKLEELAAELRLQRPELQNASVERLLKGMKDLELSDGQIISLASADESGAWRARNI